LAKLGAAADNINAVTAANPSKYPFVMIMPPLVGLVVNGTTSEAPFSGK
jgi:hypothetical protein